MTPKNAFCCLVIAVSTSLIPMAWSKERAAVPAAKTPVSRAPTPKALQAAVGLTRDEVIKRFGKPRTASDNSFSYGTENEYTGQAGGCYLWFFETDRVQQIQC